MTTGESVVAVLGLAHALVVDVEDAVERLDPVEGDRHFGGADKTGGGTGDASMVLVLDDMWDSHRNEISVRGICMNPVDHPHGGGEGKTSGGRHPVPPWGQPTRGYKTRNNKRTDGFIVRRRKSKG